MTELEWIKKLHREDTIDQLTLNALKDWMEERGDRRLEKIKVFRVCKDASFPYIFWVYTPGEEFPDRFYSLEMAWKAVANTIEEILLMEDG